MEPKSILAFDIDGTLTRRNIPKILPEKLTSLLNALDEMGHFSVPVTGKPASYAKNLLEVSGLEHRGIIAENGGVYQKNLDDMLEIFGQGIESIENLKESLGLTKKREGIYTINLDGTAYEIGVDEGDLSIFTLFTDSDRINLPRQFNPQIDANFLFEKLKELTVSSGWENKLEILKPFPDKALQILRKDPKTGKAIDKYLLPEIVRLMFKLKETPLIAMFGDGHNDIPAMEPKEVFPVTFSNAEEGVKSAVKRNSGYISPFPAPDGLGVVDGLLWLAEKRKFFGDDCQNIISRISFFFPELKNT